MEEAALSMYASGGSLKEVAEACDKSKSWIYSVAEANDLLRSKSDGRRIYSLNQDAFSEENSKKYHVLGLFATDGCVTMNRSSHVAQLSLHHRDTDLLMKVRDFFGTDKPLYASKEQRVLAIISRKICDVLRSFGIVERKSLVLSLSKRIPCLFVPDFLLGCFEGDGSLACDSLDMTLCVSASEIFAGQVFDMAASIGHPCHLYSYKGKRENTLFHVKLYGAKALSFLKMLYKSRDFSMHRKHALFVRHQERYDER